MGESAKLAEALKEAENALMSLQQEQALLTARIAQVRSLPC